MHKLLVNTIIISLIYCAAVPPIARLTPWADIFKWIINADRV